MELITDYIQNFIPIIDVVVHCDCGRTGYVGTMKPHNQRIYPFRAYFCECGKKYLREANAK